MEKKDSFFKKMFYTGIGIAALTKEKFEEAIEELVKDKKMSTDEGKKIIDDFVKNVDSKKDEIEDQMKEFVEKTTKKFKFVKKDEIDELEKRIQELEAKLITKKEIDKE
jgi:polyhydroxyalkanoate synthesis regulator phasin